MMHANAISTDGVRGICHYYMCWQPMANKEEDKEDRQVMWYGGDGLEGEY